MKLQFVGLLCMLTLQHCVSYEPLVLAPAITLSPELVSLSSNGGNDDRVDFGFEVGVNESDSLFNIEVLPGVRVRTIEPSGPANSAGLKVGDIILSIDDTPTDHPDTVTALQQSENNDLNFELKVRRGTVVFQAGMLARLLLWNSIELTPSRLKRAIKPNLYKLLEGRVWQPPKLLNFSPIAHFQAPALLRATSSSH